MPTYLAPGVYVEERNTGARPIVGVSTSTAAFVGVTERGPVGQAVLITGFAQFVKKFGGPIYVAPGTREHYLYYAVQSFFALGGSRCYVVRVAHYANIDVATPDATAAFATFNAQTAAGATVAALRVSAMSPGTWGSGVSVGVASTTGFQTTLDAAIAAGAATSFTIPGAPTANPLVVPGTVLELVHEITGVVGSVVTLSTSPDFRGLTFAGPLIPGTGTAGSRIVNGAIAFKPDFSLITTVNVAATVDLSVAGGNPPAANTVKLADVTGLMAGDAITFVVDQAIVVVLAVEAATNAASQTVTRVIIARPPASVTLPDLPAARTRVYARDFAVEVQVAGSVVERHERLSLVAEHPEHVERRLRAVGGESQYIVAAEAAAALPDNIVMLNAPAAALGGAPSDGLTNLSVADFVGSDLAKNGLHALDAVEDASILVVPPSRITSTAQPDPVVHQRNLTAQVISWVENRRDMFYIIDPPRSPASTAVQDVRSFRNPGGAASPLSSSYAGIYFPWIVIADPFPSAGRDIAVPPSGAVAGVFARSDTRRGVHKAPAGLDVGLISVATGTAYAVSPGDNDVLYQENINAIRNLTEGIVVWGSRTISADPLWLQVNIRRLFIFLERSIELNTQWVVFEPNDPALWKAIERTIRSFLRVQWREGKLVGTTEEEAFFVHCNAETNPPEVVDDGRVVTEIGVAPSRPAEFVVFRISQFAGREA